MEELQSATERYLEVCEEYLGANIETITIAGGASGEYGVKVHAFDPEVYEQFLLVRQAEPEPSA